MLLRYSSFFFKKRAGDLPAPPTESLKSVAPPLTSTRSTSSDSLVPERKVSFYNTVEVVLIPQCEEYYQAGIHNDIWYGCNEVENDFDRFKKEARQEVLALMEEKKKEGITLSFREALTLLCQLENSETNPSVSAQKQFG